MLLASSSVGRYDLCAATCIRRAAERAGAMTQGDIGPGGEAGAAVAAAKPKRTIFGPIGLVLSLVPGLVVLAMFLIRPG